MNSMPKYVVSTTLQELEWNNSTLIDRDVEQQVAALKDQPGQDILVAGSRTLAQSLQAAGLVDEYRLMVFPIVLGSGKRLFGDSVDATTLTLADSKTLGSGTLILTYRAV